MYNLPSTALRTGPIGYGTRRGASPPQHRQQQLLSGGAQHQELPQPDEDTSEEKTVEYDHSGGQNFSALCFRAREAIKASRQHLQRSLSPPAVGGFGEGLSSPLHAGQLADLSAAIGIEVERAPGPGGLGPPQGTNNKPLASRRNGRYTMVGTGAAKELRMLDADMYDYKTTKTPATSTNSKPSYSRGARHASASAQPRRPQGSTSSATSSSHNLATGAGPPAATTHPAVASSGSTLAQQKRTSTTTSRLSLRSKTALLPSKIGGFRFMKKSASTESISPNGRRLPFQPQSRARGVRNGEGSNGRVGSGGSFTTRFSLLPSSRLKVGGDGGGGGAGRTTDEHDVDAPRTDGEQQQQGSAPPPEEDEVERTTEEGTRTHIPWHDRDDEDPDQMTYDAGDSPSYYFAPQQLENSPSKSHGAVEAGVIGPEEQKIRGQLTAAAASPASPFLPVPGAGANPIAGPLGTAAALGGGGGNINLASKKLSGPPGQRASTSSKNSTAASSTAAFYPRSTFRFASPQLTRFDLRMRRRASLRDLQEAVRTNDRIVGGAGGVVLGTAPGGRLRGMQQTARPGGTTSGGADVIVMNSGPLLARPQPPAPGATASVGSNRSANASKRSTTFAGSTSFVEQPSALTSKEASGSGTTEDALSGGDITGDCEQPLQQPATLAASASRSNSRSGYLVPHQRGSSKNAAASCMSKSSSMAELHHPGAGQKIGDNDKNKRKVKLKQAEVAPTCGPPAPHDHQHQGLDQMKCSRLTTKNPSPVSSGCVPSRSSVVTTMIHETADEILKFREQAAARKPVLSSSKSTSRSRTGGPPPAVAATTSTSSSSGGQVVSEEAHVSEFLANLGLDSLDLPPEKLAALTARSREAFRKCAPASKSSTGLAVVQPTGTQQQPAVRKPQVPSHVVAPRASSGGAAVPVGGGPTPASSSHKATPAPRSYVPPVAISSTGNNVGSSIAGPGVALTSKPSGRVSPRGEVGPNKPSKSLSTRTAAVSPRLTAHTLKMVPGAGSATSRTAVVGCPGAPGIAEKEARGNAPADEHKYVKASCAPSPPRGSGAAGRHPQSVLMSRKTGAATAIKGPHQGAPASSLDHAFPPTSTAASPPAGGASPSAHTTRLQSWANNNSTSTSFGDTKQIIIEALQNFEESDGELLKMKSQQHLSEILEKAIAVVEAQRPKGANCADLIEVLARRCAKFGHDAGLCRKTMRIFVHCIYHVGSELLRATVFEAVIGMVERSDAASGDPLIEHQAMLVFANGLKAGKIRIGLFSRAVRLAVQRVGACREVCYFLIEAATRYGQDYGQICLRLGCLRLLDTVPESYAKEREHARTAINQAVAKLSSTNQACGVNFDHFLPELDEELNLKEGFVNV